MSNPAFPDPARGGPHRPPQFGAVPPPQGYRAPVPPWYPQVPPPGYGPQVPPAGYGPQVPPAGYGPQVPPGYGPAHLPPGYGPPPRRGGMKNRTGLWIVAGVVAAVIAFFAVGIALSPPHTPLCNAYRDLNDAMRENPFFVDVSSELAELRKQADADPDSGVRADGEKLDHMGVTFDSNDVEAATRNIAEKC